MTRVLLKRALPYLTLFTSFGTLVCCALPALFVSLGLGASLVSLLGAVPQLIWFSEHKAVVFGGAAIMFCLTALLRWYGADSCPSDPVLGQACARTRRVSVILVYVSLALFGTGVFFAFIAPLVWV